MAPGEDKESNYLRSELLRILLLDLQNARYDSDGFLMLKHLLEHLQLDSHQNKFLNVLKFANLARAVNESEASLISRAHRGSTMSSKAFPLLTACL